MEMEYSHSYLRCRWNNYQVSSLLYFKTHIYDDFDYFRLADRCSCFISEHWPALFSDAASGNWKKREAHGLSDLVIQLQFLVCPGTLTKLEGSAFFTNHFLIRLRKWLVAFWDETGNLIDLHIHYH